MSMCQNVYKPNVLECVAKSRNDFLYDLFQPIAKQSQKLDPKTKKLVTQPWNATQYKIIDLVFNTVLKGVVINLEKISGWGWSQAQSEVQGLLNSGLGNNVRQTYSLPDGGYVVRGKEGHPSIAIKPNLSLIQANTSSKKYGGFYFAGSNIVDIYKGVESCTQPILSYSTVRTAELFAGWILPKYTRSDANVRFTISIGKKGVKEDALDNFITQDGFNVFLDNHPLGPRWKAFCCNCIYKIDSIIRNIFDVSAFFSVLLRKS